MEAREFREASEQIRGKHALLLGISPDAPKAQAKFKAKFDLNFTLLCDVEKHVAEAYEVIKEKNMYGRKVMGIERTTFIIGKDGKVEKIFPKVKPEGHAGQVVEAL